MRDKTELRLVLIMKVDRGVWFGFIKKKKKKIESEEIV